MKKEAEDLLDELVAEYQDALATGSEPAEEPFLARAPEAHRDALARCLRLMRAGAASAPRASKALLPGVRVGGNQLVREIGRGGMSIVYLATQLDLRRPVALKVLRPGLSVDASHVDRFEREALAIARLQHPHIVQVHGVGHDEGWHWIAMEWIEGRNLAQIFAELGRRELDPARRSAELLAECAGIAPAPFAGLSYAAALCKLLAPVARAVGVAHEIGLVHRDVKPSNILVHKDGRAMIADFGLAKGDGDPALSLTGEPLGTPYYMSPEQAQLVRTPVDRRTDVYSLGVTLYEGLSGRRPFDGKDVLAVLEAIRSREAPPLAPAMAAKERGAESVVERAMAKAAADRYVDAFDLARDLEAVAEGRAPQALVQHGSEWSRFRRACAAAARGQQVEYRTRATLLGWPVVHAHLGPRRRPEQAPRVAKGWLALGERAVGLVAVGNFAAGGVALGALTLGAVSVAGLAGGLYSIGGLSAGAVAFGGVAAGYAAVGGLAVGHHAAGGATWGTHEWNALERDPETEELLNRLPLPIRLPDLLTHGTHPPPAPR